MGFTGREWDAETQLYFYRARYYDPQLGRFLSEDPIGLAGGINPYVYAGNDPVNHKDPYGLDTTACYDPDGDGECGKSGDDNGGGDGDPAHRNPSHGNGKGSDGGSTKGNNLKINSPQCEGATKDFLISGVLDFAGVGIVKGARRLAQVPGLRAELRAARATFVRTRRTGGIGNIHAVGDAGSAYYSAAITGVGNVALDLWNRAPNVEEMMGDILQGNIDAGTATAALKLAPWIGTGIEGKEAVNACF